MPGGVAVTAVEAEPLPRSGGVADRRRPCVACGRSYGRLRVPAGGGDESEAGLWGCAELIVCDQCWHLAGGATGVRTRLDVVDGAVEPLLVLPPDVEAVLAGAADHDLLHPLDRLLTDSGVRWAVLRHIAVPARMTLAGWVLRSTPPDRTRPAESARLWLDEVEDRVRAQSGTGGFVHTARKNRWWRVAHQLACAAARERRPLTWMAQEDVADAVGCSTRTVRRVVRWLHAEGLLWEVAPGCRLPQQHVPDGERPQEAVDRRRRMAAAVAAEQAAIRRAHAEPDSVRTGLQGAAAAAHAQHHPPGTEPADEAPIDVFALEELVDNLLPPALVHLAPVYELRLPEIPAELAPTTAAVDQPETASTSENTDPDGPAHSFVRPPQVLNQDHISSSSLQPVDTQRRAPRGLDPKDSDGADRGAAVGTLNPRPERVGGAPAHPAEGDPQPSPQSQAVRAAQWLLRSRLDPRLCGGVSVWWLTNRIRETQLLDRHGWTWEDLADQLRGEPAYSHLPRDIPNPRGFLKARLAAASPALPPSRLRLVLHLERNGDLFRHRRETEQDDARAAAAATLHAVAAARQAAIDACTLCDEHGWLDLGPQLPDARCTHDSSTSGW